MAFLMEVDSEKLYEDIVHPVLSRSKLLFKFLLYCEKENFFFPKHAFCDGIGYVLVMTVFLNFSLRQGLLGTCGLLFGFRCLGLFFPSCSQCYWKHSPFLYQLPRKWRCLQLGHATHCSNLCSQPSFTGHRAFQGVFHLTLYAHVCLMKGLALLVLNKCVH